MRNIVKKLKKYYGSRNFDIMSQRRIPLAPDWRIAEVMMAVARGLEFPPIQRENYGLAPRLVTPPIPTRLNISQVQSLVSLPTELLKKEIISQFETYKKTIDELSPDIYHIVSSQYNIVYDYNNIRVELEQKYKSIRELFVKYKQRLVNVQSRVDDQICSICTEKCSNMVILDSCKHTFCSECILKWAYGNNVKCPNCRGVDIFLLENQPLSPPYDPFEDKISRYYGMTDDRTVKSEIIENIFETTEGMSYTEKIYFIKQHRENIRNKKSFIQLGTLLESLNRIYLLVQVNLPLFEKLRKIEMYYSRESYDLEVTDWCFFQTQIYLEEEQCIKDEKLARQLQDEFSTLPSLVIFPDEDVQTPVSPRNRHSDIRVQTPVSP